MLALEDPVVALEGIGARTASSLAEQLDIHTVRDLVEHYPRRYEDLGELVALSAARVGHPATIVGSVAAWTHRRARNRRLRISEAEVHTPDGGTLLVTFFNQPWLERKLPAGRTAGFSGVLERRYGALRMTSPEVQDDLGAHRRIVPVYAATEGISSARLAGWISTALAQLPPFEDHLPRELREGYGLVDLDAALRHAHEPPDHAAKDAALARLIFDELFTLQVGLQWRRARLESHSAGLDNAPIPDGLPHRYLESLPFRPTRGQWDAFVEIAADLASDRPMHRLLQGEVGAGKTLVATWTMLCAVDRGRQAVLMAPTEVLAEQHHRTLTDQLAPLGVNVLDGIRIALLTSSTTATERRRVLGELLSGDLDIVVGTHALLEEGVRFHELGVVVVDEQHRFGVSQRVRLREKARGDDLRTRTGDPDVLVMTATPIPRSLALTLFGDLDVTTLDELPAGRQQITTQLITPRESHRREALYDFVRQQANAGHQTYVVCPLIEGSEEVSARAAEEEYERLRDVVFPDLSVGLVHGRLRPDDKEAVMARFRRGEVDVLVATTVIEVGVDVPNATVMIVEDAERFGISQLHQLRGRIGRGSDRSYCVLFAGWSGEVTPEAEERLRAVAATSDGFALAEADLRLRGEGQLFGVRQSGVPDLRLVRLSEHRREVEQTRRAAIELVASDPELARPEHAPLRAEVLRRYKGGLEELEALTTG